MSLPYHVVDITSWWVIWGVFSSVPACISGNSIDAEGVHAQAMWEVVEKPRAPKGTYKVWTCSHASLHRPKKFYSLTTANDFADAQKFPRPPAKPTASAETHAPVAAIGGTIPFDQETTLAAAVSVEGGSDLAPDVATAAEEGPRVVVCQVHICPDITARTHSHTELESDRMSECGQNTKLDENNLSWGSHEIIVLSHLLFIPTFLFGSHSLAAGKFRSGHSRPCSYLG